MKQGWRSALAVGGGLSLGLPFAAAALTLLASPGLYPSGLIEVGVFAFIIVRVVAYLAFPKLRGMSPGALIVLFSGDIFLLPTASIASVLTGDPAPAAFARVFLSSWLSSGLVVFPGVAAFAIARLMMGRGRLSRVLPAAALSFGISSVVLEGMAAGPQSGGLEQVAYLAAGVLRGPTAPLPLESALLFASSAVLFVALATYAATMAEESGRMLTARLAVGVAGTAAVLAWAVAVPPLGPSLTLGIPTGAIVSGVWLMTRET